MPRLRTLVPALAALSLAAVEGNTAPVITRPLSDGDFPGPSYGVIEGASVAIDFNEIQQNILDYYFDGEGLNWHAARGIALQVVQPTSGTWNYRQLDPQTNTYTYQDLGALPTDADGTWLRLPLLHVANPQLVFTPADADLDWNGTMALQFHAWDGTDGVADLESAPIDDQLTENGAISSESRRLSFGVLNVPDTPTLNPLGSTKVIAAGSTEPRLFPVGDLLDQASASDPDTAYDGVDLAIAIVQEPTDAGTWWYQPAGQSEWTAFPTDLSWYGNWLTLARTTTMRFIPNAGFIGQTQLQYKAWDRRLNTNARTDLAGTEATYASTAFDPTSDYVGGVYTTIPASTSGSADSITIIRNASPVITDTTGPDPATIFEDDSSWTGWDLATLWNPETGLISDADLVQPPLAQTESLLSQFRQIGSNHSGLALVGVTGTGTWYLDSKNGTFQVPDDLSDTNALLWDLQVDPATLRFVPAANWFGEATVLVRGWDATQYQHRDLVDTTGDTPALGSGTFSGAVLPLAVTVRSVNDAPVVLDGPKQIGSISANNADPSPIPLDAYASYRISDADGGPFGLVITSASTDGGRWQYRPHGATGWLDMPTNLDTQVLHLRLYDELGSAQVRFVPDGSGTGTTASLQWRAWDGYDLPELPSVVPPFIDTGAYSERTGSFTVAVTGNQAPTFKTQPPIVYVNEGGDGDATILDLATWWETSVNDDGPATGYGAQIIGSNGNGTWQWRADATSTWQPIIDVPLTITAPGQIRFVPSPEASDTAQAQLRAIDGLGAVSQAVQAYNVTITPVNDAPVISDTADVPITVTAGGATDPIEPAALWDARITDIDGPDRGLAVIAATGPGTWEVSTDGGATWNELGTITDDAAYLLHVPLPDTQSQLPPNAAFRFGSDAAGEATLVVRAWDASNPIEGGYGTDATVNGGESAFSAETVAYRITVEPQTNQPPVRADGAFYTGSVVQGGILTAIPGTWTDPENDTVVTSVAWNIANDAEGSGAVSVTGSTLDLADLADRFVRVVITASDGANTVVAASSYVAVAANQPPVRANAPFFTGQPNVGQTLTAIPGTWTDPENDTVATTVAWEIADDDQGSNSQTIASATIDLTGRAGRWVRVVIAADDGFNAVTAQSPWTQVSGNQVPVRVTSGPLFSGIPNADQTLTATPGTWTDPEDGTVMPVVTWLVADDAQGTNAGEPIASSTLALADLGGRFVRVTVSATDSQGTTGSDSSGWIRVNRAPFLASEVGAVAIVGQPYQALIAADDPDAGSSVAIQVSGLPQGLTYGTNGITGTPLSAGTTTITITLDDGQWARTVQASITAFPSLGAAAISEPALTLSTASAVSYGAIAPGSTAGFASLADALAGTTTSQARAFWWDATAYRELPQLPPTARHPTAAVFVANTIPLSFNFDATPLPAPFPVPLAPGWNFVGVPVLTDGSQPLTQHPWADFRLETAAGIPVTDSTAIVAVLGTTAGGLDTARPYAWDGATYTQVDTLITGRGYWVRNRTASDYRLVRRLPSVVLTTLRAAASPTTTGAAGAAANQATSVRNLDTPPAPPSGSPAPKAEGGSGGGCGGGVGLAGLLLAVLGLRRRQRN